MMERYKEYKDSGVKWLGEIPSHWKIEPFGRHFRFRKGLPITKKDLKESGIAVISYGQIHANNNLGTTLSESLIRYVSQDYLLTHPQCLLTKNDFIFADTSEDMKGSGNFVYNDFREKIFAGYHTIVARQNGLYNFKYYAYLFMSDVWKNHVRALVNGVKVYSIGRKQLKVNFLLFPLPPEQDAIVRYLDSATSEIDKAIAMQQKMIDLLNERKQIIIQNAVTKGLDENVEMKESGVESIGRIPIGWKIKKLKYVMRSFGRIGFRGYGTKDIVDEGQGAITLSPSNIQESSMDYSKRTYLSWNKYYESPEIMIENGDVLMVKTGSSYGKCAIVKNMPMECTINPQLVVFKEHTEMPEYLAYCFQTSFAKFFINTSVIGGTIPTISQEKINNYVFPFPPKPDQKQIVTYLDSEMQKFDTAITNCQRQITLLQERKQIIINEVVTGKVRVS